MNENKFEFSLDLEHWEVISAVSAAHFLVGAWGDPVAVVSAPRPRPIVVSARGPEAQPAWIRISPPA